MLTVKKSSDTFICDVCNKEIRGGDGLVQWIEYVYPNEIDQPIFGEGLAAGYLIVHQHEKMEAPDSEDVAGGFEPPLSGMLRSCPIAYFYTSEGFMHLLRLLGLKDHNNNNAIAELAWRLYYPCYEEARTVFARLKEANVIPEHEGSYKLHEYISVALKFIESGYSDEWIQEHLAQRRNYEI